MFWPVAVLGFIMISLWFHGWYKQHQRHQRIARIERELLPAYRLGWELGLKQAEQAVALGDPISHVRTRNPQLNDFLEYQVYLHSTGNDIVAVGPTDLVLDISAAAAEARRANLSVIESTVIAPASSPAAEEMETACSGRS